MNLRLTLLPDLFAVCRLDHDTPIPTWALTGSFSSITRTPDEVSIVCVERDVPPGIQHEPGWRCLKVEGPLDFALVGIMASLTTALAQAGISLFAVSTYDTDYLLVKATDLERATVALTAAGHRVG